MAEYIEREAVLALADDFELTLEDDEIFFEYIAPKNVKALPAADVRPVVYCKDCVHYVRGELFGDMVCDYHYRNHYHMEENDFCSKAKMREASE